jgi:hypothetical protein
VIPVVLGFAWSAIGDPTHAYNVLDPPEGYTGRLPDSRITVEPWGASVVAVPFRLRLHEYLARAQLPLWNPYQGIGQPFAAEGEGNPFFPIAIVRAILPYQFENYVAFAAYALAAVCLYQFLRGLGTSDVAAVFGGVTYAMSGALSLQIARPNLADQVVMLPILFWAMALAIRKRTALGYVLLVAASALHIVGGFLQIAFANVLLTVAFCIFYTRLRTVDTRAWVTQAAMALGAFALGLALGAVSLLPQLDAIQTIYGKNPELSSFGAIPYANVIMFFFPTLFGPFFVNWVPGSYPEVADWNNLFAFVGAGVLLLVIMGWSLTSGRTALRRLYLFFAIAGVVLTLRYISFPLISGVDMLPILGRQSPKHANGAMAFCFIVAAAISLDFLRARPQVRVRRLLALCLLAIASTVLTHVGQRGGPGAIDYKVAIVYVPATAFIVAVLLGVLAVARRWSGFSARQAAIVVGTAIVAELTLYIPLGNTTTNFLFARLAIFAAVVGIGFCFAFQRIAIATVAMCVVAVGYGAMIALPASGLPQQYPLDRAPAFITWLQGAEGDTYRSYGIWPEGSSVGPLQDIGAVGPLAPYAFRDFVDLVADDKQAKFYHDTTTFLLAGLGENLGMAQYQKTQPVMDWMGVRYLVLDRALFNPGARTDEVALLRNGFLSVAYQDDRVMILESPHAQQKAIFATSIDVMPDRSAVLQSLKDNPGSINGPPRIEAAQVSVASLGDLAARPAQPSTPLSVETYTPNFVRVIVDAPTSGLVVLKDAFAPGWEAQVDGQPSQIIRVDGIARGVFVPSAGRHVVDMTYRPASFTAGAWLSGVVVLLLGAIAISALLTRSSIVPRWAIGMGAAAIVAFGVLVVRTYFG